MSTLFDALGADKIKSILTRFYERAMIDPMLLHFFMDKDHDELVRQQITFVSALLGGPQEYRGRPLAAIHKPLNIRKPHLMRRQVLLHEAMIEEGVSNEIAQEWLRREAEFSHLILARK